MRKVIKCFLIISLFTLTQVNCISLDATYRIGAQQFCNDIIDKHNNEKIYNQCVSRLKDQYDSEHGLYMLLTVTSSVLLSALGISIGTSIQL